MPLNKEKMRDYMRERRKKKYAESQAGIGEEKDSVTGRYPDRTYKEDGSLELFEQRSGFESCKGIWSASIEIPCPYCGGSGKRRYA